MPKTSNIAKYLPTLLFAAGVFASCSSSTSSQPANSVLLGNWSEIGNNWMGRRSGDSTFKFGLTIDSSASGLSVLVKQDQYVLQQQTETAISHKETPGTILEDLNGQVVITWDAYSYTSAMQLSWFHDSLGGAAKTSTPRLIYLKKQ